MPARWPLPNFLPRPARPPVLAWVALLVTGAAVAMVGDEWLALRELRVERERDADRREAALRPAAARSSSVALPPQRAAALREAWALQRQLDFPWREVFEVTEQAAAGAVRWRRLDADAQRDELLVEGEAPDRPQVLATLEAWTTHAGRDDATLQRLEPVAAPGSGWRFELRGHAAPAANP